MSEDEMTTANEAAVQPYDLKEYLTPPEGWVLPVFLVCLVATWGVHLALYDGAIDDACDQYAEWGDTNCDGRYGGPGDVVDETMATPEEDSTDEQDEDASSDDTDQSTE